VIVGAGIRAASRARENEGPPLLSPSRPRPDDAAGKATVRHRDRPIAESERRIEAVTGDRHLARDLYAPSAVGGGNRAEEKRFCAASSINPALSRAPHEVLLFGRDGRCQLAALCDRPRRQGHRRQVDAYGSSTSRSTSLARRCAGTQRR
jgi:hypothetical protein